MFVIYSIPLSDTVVPLFPVLYRINRLSRSVVHRSALDEAARLQRLINGQSAYTVVSTVRDRHKQLTNVLVTYGRTIFSRPYCTNWTLAPP